MYNQQAFDDVKGYSVYELMFYLEVAKEHMIKTAQYQKEIEDKWNDHFGYFYKGVDVKVTKVDKDGNEYSYLDTSKRIWCVEPDHKMFIKVCNNAYNYITEIEKCLEQRYIVHGRTDSIMDDAVKSYERYQKDMAREVKTRFPQEVTIRITLPVNDGTKGTRFDKRSSPERNKQVSTSRF